MRESRARGVWNGVVRRAQETLEMSLKAVLLELGTDYPRQHDVAPLLVRRLRERGERIDDTRLDALVRASASLASARAPALYAEIVCTEQEAEAAAAAAEDAFRLACEIAGEPPDRPFQP
jgi:HEPN domain-containing protein